MDLDKLEADCRAVLTANDRGDHTVPAGDLYPHQWLWDSCFTAIGLRHMDIERAKQEVCSLFEGQWSNGMLPHIVFNKHHTDAAERRVWSSHLSPYSPDHRTTSGITQPPVVAEAVVRIGKMLPLTERRTWYKHVWENVLAYHLWLYKDRDPHHEGLVLQIHPYETGLDSTPPWMAQLHEHNHPWWISIIETLKLENAFNFIRRDTRRMPIVTRMSNIDALLYWDVINRLRRKHYEIERILHRSLFVIEDLTFNSIFIRANTQLQHIAQAIGAEIPEELHTAILNSRRALEKLWDEDTHSYYSRDFVTHKLLPEQSIAALMPLYAGTVSKERAAELVGQLTDKHRFWPEFPVPSVPLDSPDFNSLRYWEGPSWVNTNWLLIDGLRRYGFIDEADDLALKTVTMVAQAGCYEYFSPLDGQGLGAPDFSWTAALTLDLLKSKD